MKLFHLIIYSSYTGILLRLSSMFCHFLSAPYRINSRGTTTHFHSPARFSSKILLALISLFLPPSPLGSRNSRLSFPFPPPAALLLFFFSSFWFPYLSQLFLFPSLFLLYSIYVSIALTFLPPVTVSPRTSLSHLTLSLHPPSRSFNSIGCHHTY